ncbi:MAG: hypothetical protein WBM02_05340 [bacterium]
MKRAGFLGFCILLVALLSSVFFIGCEKADDPLNPDDRTPTPGNTPTPFQSPTPEPTPGSSMWGYINGSALVEVSGLEYNPYNEKESIFHLYHPTTQAWLNVRHRSGGKFQIKGALDSWYGCSDDVHYEYIQPGGNGVWRIEWEQHGDTTQVVVTSPQGGSETVHLRGGAAAWREIRHGSGDARLPMASPASIRVISMTGTIGEAVHCR